MEKAKPNIVPKAKSTEGAIPRKMGVVSKQVSSLNVKSPLLKSLPAKVLKTATPTRAQAAPTKSPPLAKSPVTAVGPVNAPPFVKAKIVTPTCKKATEPLKAPAKGKSVIAGKIAPKTISVKGPKSAGLLLSPKRPGISAKASPVAVKPKGPPSKIGSTIRPSGVPEPQPEVMNENVIDVATDINEETPKLGSEEQTPVPSESTRVAEDVADPAVNDDDESTPTIVKDESAFTEEPAEVAKGVEQPQTDAAQPSIAIPSADEADSKSVPPTDFEPARDAAQVPSTGEEPAADAVVNDGMPEQMDDKHAEVGIAETQASSPAGDLQPSMDDPTGSQDRIGEVSDHVDHEPSVKDSDSSEPRPVMETPAAAEAQPAVQPTADEVQPSMEEAPPAVEAAHLTVGEAQPTAIESHVSMEKPEASLTEMPPTAEEPEGTVEESQPAETQASEPQTAGDEPQRSADEPQRVADESQSAATDELAPPSKESQPADRQQPDEQELQPEADDTVVPSAERTDEARQAEGNDQKAPEREDKDDDAVPEEPREVHEPDDHDAVDTESKTDASAGPVAIATEPTDLPPEQATDGGETSTEVVPQASDDHADAKACSDDNSSAEEASEEPEEHSRDVSQLIVEVSSDEEELADIHQARADEVESDEKAEERLKGDTAAVHLIPAADEEIPGADGSASPCEEQPAASGPINVAVTFETGRLETPKSLETGADGPPMSQEETPAPELERQSNPMESRTSDYVSSEGAEDEILTESDMEDHVPVDEMNRATSSENEASEGPQKMCSVMNDENTDGPQSTVGDVREGDEAFAEQEDNAKESLEWLPDSQNNSIALVVDLPHSNTPRNPLSQRMAVRMEAIRQAATLAKIVQVEATKSAEDPQRPSSTPHVPQEPSQAQESRPRTTGMAPAAKVINAPEQPVVYVEQGPSILSAVQSVMAMAPIAPAGTILVPAALTSVREQSQMPVSARPPQYVAQPVRMPDFTQQSSPANFVDYTRKQSGEHSYQSSFVSVRSASDVLPDAKYTQALPTTRMMADSSRSVVMPPLSVQAVSRMPMTQQSQPVMVSHREYVAPRMEVPQASQSARQVMPEVQILRRDSKYASWDRVELRKTTSSPSTGGRSHYGMHSVGGVQDSSPRSFGPNSSIKASPDGQTTARSSDPTYTQMNGRPTVWLNQSIFTSSQTPIPQAQQPAPVQQVVVQTTPAPQPERTSVMPAPALRGATSPLMAEYAEQKRRPPVRFATPPTYDTSYRKPSTLADLAWFKPSPLKQYVELQRRAAPAAR